MYKLIALYAQPDDVDAFQKHYTEVHTPLALAVPGLQELVVNKVVASPMGGEPQYFQIAEMRFADKAAFDKAMASAENRAAGKDLMNFAKGKVTLLIAEA